MAAIHGLGHSLKRKEDPRFIRGKGNYIDDLKLPGMLYLDIVRSPYAHAKITNINTEEALKVPGVLAVITGKDLDKYGLAWMPTLMSDTQMVLPIDTVEYQAQEVAGGGRHQPLRGSRRRGRGRSRVRAAACGGGPVQGAGAGLAQSARGQGEQPHLALGGGRQGGHRPGFRGGRGHRQARHLYPAHPRRVYRDLRLRGQLGPDRRQADDVHDHPGSARHPHRDRARRRAPGPGRAQDPRDLAGHRRRLRRQSACLSGLRDRHSGLGAHRQAGQVDRGPLREPAGRLVRPRLPHHRRGGRQEGRHDDGRARQDDCRPRLHRRRRQPVQVPGGPVPRLHRLV